MQRKAAASASCNRTLFIALFLFVAAAMFTLGMLALPSQAQADLDCNDFATKTRAGVTSAGPSLLFFSSVSSSRSSISRRPRE